MATIVKGVLELKAVTRAQTAEPMKDRRTMPSVRKCLTDVAAEQTSSDGSYAECTEQQAEGCWATPDKVAGHKRHESLDCAAGETKHECANQIPS